MGQLIKMFDDELKEFARLLAERKGYIKPPVPTDILEVKCHEEVQEGSSQKGEEA